MVLCWTLRVILFGLKKQRLGLGNVGLTDMHQSHWTANANGGTGLEPASQL